MTALAIFYLVVSIFPLKDWVLRPLEERFPVMNEFPEHLDGIIVLAGAEQTAITLSRGQPTLSDCAERLISFISLSQKYPEATLVFTGGPSLFPREGENDSVTARMLFSELSLDTGRVIFEEGSYNTYDSAIRTHALVKPKQEEKWILITSAFHMPRSIGAFRKAGWDVIPYPVDYRTVPSAFGLQFEPESSLVALSIGLKEWVGLLAYRFLGRTSELFPGPQDA
jgi:uncharacterized SAM-binding protein YcdF (DUF218 family)